jgi:hypothetical protein
MPTDFLQQLSSSRMLCRGVFSLSSKGENKAWKCLHDTVRLWWKDFVHCDDSFRFKVCIWRDDGTYIVSQDQVLRRTKVSFFSESERFIRTENSGFSVLKLWSTTQGIVEVDPCRQRVPSLSNRTSHSPPGSNFIFVTRTKSSPVGKVRTDLGVTVGCRHWKSTWDASTALRLSSPLEMRAKSTLLRSGIVTAVIISLSA